MFKVYEVENGFLVEYECGCTEFFEEDDFFAMLDAEGIELIDEDGEEFYDECECCDECDCEFEDDDEFIDEELDDMLNHISEEIHECLEIGDYDGLKELSIAYEILFKLM